MGAGVQILFEDADLVAANKPSGLLAEGGADRESDLEQEVSKLTGKRALCCHRLDRLTSGVTLLRKTARYNAALAGLFEQRQTRKEYWAVVEGAWDRRVQRVESRIGPLGGGLWANVDEGGKEAVTTFRLLGYEAGLELSWLSLLLKTGRTHQARLHCQKAGCPIAGDPKYGSGRSRAFFGLHAARLVLRHPGTGAELDLRAPRPGDWPELAF